MKVFSSSLEQVYDNRYKSEFDVFSLLKYEEDVLRIIRDVKERGDEAILEYTERFDGVRLDKLYCEVPDDIEKEISPTLLDAFETMRQNIRKYHLSQNRDVYLTYNEDGFEFSMEAKPIDSVLIYVPGGKYTYISSLLMGCIPAVIAEVGKIYITTPPNKDGKVHPLLLYGAKVYGASVVYTVGGVQAIAGFSFGTKSLPKVDKIVGPGNIYVSIAKRLLYGVIDIDTFAGPSEVMVLADRDADLEFCAYEVMAQLEHDENSKAWFVSDSMDVIKAVVELIKDKLGKYDGSDVVKKAFSDNAFFVLVDGFDEATRFVNEIAPEHLYIDWSGVNMDIVKEKIRNVGAVFIGKYSSVPLGDYGIGPNHILPTMGFARFSSPLGVYDFIHRYSYINVSREYAREFIQKVLPIVEAEGLYFHAEALRKRL